MPDPSAEPTFEQRLEELNTLITSLESGELGLEDAIRTFERGRTVHGQLLAALDAFEKRIEQLTQTRGADPRLAPAPELDPDATSKGTAGGGNHDDVPF